MTVTAANDINSLYNVSSDAVRDTLLGNKTEEKGESNIFDTFLNAAVHNVNDQHRAFQSGE